MNLIPNAVGRAIAKQGLLASEKSPQILFGVGIVSMVGSTVLACRATLQLEEVLEEVQTNQNTAKDVKHGVDSGEIKTEATYTDQEFKRDMTIITVRGVGSVAKLYAPAVVLGGIGIVCLTKSHHILQDRNLALTAAYAAVDNAFKAYRERVIDRYGAETDEELRYDYREVDEINEETGELTTRQQIIDTPGSSYARWYDEESAGSFSRFHETNLMFLRQQQNYLNDKLRMRGHIFLNEVFTELGLSHTKAGAVVGWRFNQDSGDDVIDFGIWDGTTDYVRDHFNGREGAILLDFNVDGIIYDKIEEDQRDRR